MHGTTSVKFTKNDFTVFSKSLAQSSEGQKYKIFLIYEHIFVLIFSRLSLTKQILLTKSRLLALSSSVFHLHKTV